MAANTKRCPRCSTAIEKDEGCNHMTCRKCRHDFCWICMQDWSLHSNNTGGFFQCNRFLTDDANGPGGVSGATSGSAAATGARGEGSASSAAAVTDEFINSRFAVEDHGSAQLEALRTRCVT
jgi:hypothetical protein